MPLAENVLDFIADDAIEDAADALAELSHAAALLRGGARGGGSRDADAHDTDPWVRPSRACIAPPPGVPSPLTMRMRRGWARVPPPPWLREA